jgi:hypothetical protein
MLVAIFTREKEYAEELLSGIYKNAATTFSVSSLPP